MDAVRIGVHRVVLSATVSFLALAACTGGGADIPGSVRSPLAGPAAIDWSSRPTTTVALDGGFGVIACPGDAPFLCVQRDGSTVGQIEYFSYEAPGKEGDAALETLRGMVMDDYRHFSSDRTGCSEGFEVETEEPVEAPVGGSTGLRSEYSVVDSGGDTVERYVKYWSVSGGRVHLLTAEAQEPRSCSPGEGAVFSTEALEEFESSFEAVAEVSRFPVGELEGY